MGLSPLGYEYPAQSISVEPYPANFSSIIPPPPGLIEGTWPPTQLEYLGIYLSELGCKTVVTESHYVDRDYIQDMSLFYARSLRDYPNFCQRLHFFKEPFDQQRWKSMFIDGANRTENNEFLQNSYLGFCVIRPLPGSPIGRTVLSTFGTTTQSGLTRRFDAVRNYDVHLGGVKLTVTGLAFQQQDQGVSACATTALWSSVHKVADMERLAIPSPAQITEAASRYLLTEGRALPSEGLYPQQISEAIRAVGLQPLVIRSVSLEDDRAQLFGYISSGLAPVLAIQPIDGGNGHAVCAVGLKLGDITPPPDPALHYREVASSVRAVYIHDDRLGPYATAELVPWTLKTGVIGTGIRIQWPDRAIEAEQSILRGIIVPVPAKLRMPITRLRALGLALAQAAASLFQEFPDGVIFNCRYILATDYQDQAHSYGLTPEGLYSLNCETVLSRYTGLIELTTSNGPLFDVLLDATETMANPSIRALVRRKEVHPKYKARLEIIAKNCAAKMIW